MKTSKTFRCYTIYQKGSKYNTVGKPRTSEYKFISALDTESAYMFYESHYVKPRKNEFVMKIIVHAWAEDRALRDMGAKPLPLDFSDSG